MKPVDHARALCHALGIPTIEVGELRYCDPIGLVAWTGSAMALNAPIYDVYHDIGHWLVASDRARRRFDFFLTKFGAACEEGANSLGIVLHADIDPDGAERHAHNNGVNSVAEARALAATSRRADMKRARAAIVAAGYERVLER